MVRMCDAASKVSAHYVVDEDGSIYQLVDETARAWHAGVSSWRGETKINHVSVGIEIVNPGHEFGYRAFPKVQMQSVLSLSKDVIARHGIAARNVVGHSDVAPARKEDPGELFDWQWLAGEGVGLWPGLGIGHEALGTGDMSARDAQQKLAEYGYAIDITGVWDEQTAKVSTAFQRHFRQKNIDGQWDGECQALLAALLGLL